MLDSLSRRSAVRPIASAQREIGGAMERADRTENELIRRARRVAAWDWFLFVGSFLLIVAVGLGIAAAMR
jgi:hypothetical protein